MNANSNAAKIENSAPAAPVAPVFPRLAEAKIALTKKPLAETNAVSADSVEFYLAALAETGISPESLSFAETVEVTRRLYSISDKFRETRRKVREAEAEAKAAEAKAAKAEAEKAKVASEAAAILARAKELGITL